MGWVVLSYKLSSNNSSARVAVWREVRRSGALHVQRSVVAFPDHPAFRRAVERFRVLVADAGGETLALRAEPFGDIDAAKLTDAWNEARSAEYGELRAECGKFLVEIEHEFAIEKFTLAELEEEEVGARQAAALAPAHRRARHPRSARSRRGCRSARSGPGGTRALHRRGVRAHPALTLVVGIGAFAAGLWLLVESVEGLITSLRGWALAAGVSGIVVGALVLGFDVESTAAGVAATLDDLPGTALGASIGAAIFLVTCGLGIAALIAPFAVRPPTVMLAAGAVATALCIALAADGELSRIDGAVLLAAFVPLVAAIVLRRAEGRAGRRCAARSGQGCSRSRSSAGSPVCSSARSCWCSAPRRIVSELGLSETVFGLLVVGAAVSFEEVVLEALPAFRGFPELSVGNALGTLVFLLTGSLGVIVLARPITVPATVTSYHLPALALTVFLAGATARARAPRPRSRAPCSSPPTPATPPEPCSEAGRSGGSIPHRARCDERCFGVGVGHPLGLELGAARVDERHDHRQVPRGGNVGAEFPVGLPAFDERHQHPEHGAVAMVELLVRLLADVDGDQRVVAPERPPCRGDHALERVRGVAALGLRRGDDGGDLGERTLGDGFQQRFAGGEVHVDGRPHDPCPAGDLGHARLRVLAESVDRRVEDARDTALRVRAPARPVSFPGCVM